jgi:hypothetical protein
MSHTTHTTGLISVRNAIEDESLVVGAGAFELAAAARLDDFKKTVEGKAKLGVAAFAEAMRIIPKTYVSVMWVGPVGVIVLFLNLRWSHTRDSDVVWWRVVCRCVQGGEWAYACASLLSLSVVT